MNNKWIIFLCFLLVLGCSSKKPEKDPFFDQWRTLAKESLGHSPSPSLKKVEIEKGLKLASPPTTKKASPALPTFPVSLKMRDTDIKAIIQALAKAARQNIILSSNLAGKINVNIEKVPWNQAFEALLKANGLTYTWEGNIIRVMSKEDFARDLAIEEIKTQKEAQEEAKKQISPLITQVIKINFADANSLQKVLSSLLTKDKEGKSRGSIVVDSHTNSLVIQATEEDLQKIIKMIGVLDKPTDQIHLKAYIVEATRNVARDLGIQWGGKWFSQINNKDQIGIQGPIGSDSGDAFGTGRSGNSFGFNFPTGQVTGSSVSTLGAGLNVLIGNPAENILEMQLSALEAEGKINILSSPSLTTMDNHMAFTENGQKVPYVTYEDGDKEVKFEDAVLRLEMTPHVINEDYLKMEIKVKKDEVDFSEEKKVDGNPTIYKKETQTSLIVGNGETIVISGLSKQTLQDSISGIPGLKDIPGLGYLFKGDSKSKKMEEILIFITPTILKRKSELAKEVSPTLSPEDLEQLKPTHDPRAQKWLAESKKYLQEKNYKEALRTAYLALSLDPGLVEAYLNAAQAYLAQAKPQKALKECNKALILAPSWPSAYNVKGEVLEKLGYPQEALKFYQKGCALEDDSACENHKRLFYQLTG